MALVLLALPGCFDSHGVLDDAGSPGGDGGICLALPAVVNAIRCEAVPGGESFAVITTTPSRCCSSGTVTPTVIRAADDFHVDLAWTACDCCEGCRCIGPVEEVRVPIGVLAPGTYTVSSHGSSCTLAITAPPMCRAVTPDEVRMPRVCFDDQPLAFTMIEREETSCGCEPRTRLSTVTALSVGMELCNCCDVCDCIDSGYEASVVAGEVPVGEHTVATPGGPLPFTVITRDRCRPLEATGLRIVAPEPTFHQTGPAIHWAVVSGVDVLCCAPPAPAVDEGTGPAGERALALRSCVQEDCDCVGRPTDVEAWHPLIDLAPGTHVVRAGAFTQTITVAP